MLKKFAKLAVLPVLGLALSSSEDASAALTANAASCYTFQHIDLQRGVGIANTQNSDVMLFCPLHLDHALSTTVTYRVRMSDNNPNNGENITCNGAAYNQDGSQVGSTSANMVSGTGTFTGSVTRTASVTLPSQSSSYMYLIYCEMPPTFGPGMSTLGTVRVF